MNYKEQYIKESLEPKKAWIVLIVILIVCLLADNL